MRISTSGLPRTDHLVSFHSFFGGSTASTLSRDKPYRWSIFSVAEEDAEGAGRLGTSSSRNRRVSCRGSTISMPRHDGGLGIGRNVSI